MNTTLPAANRVRTARAEDWRVLAILGPYRLVLVVTLFVLYHLGYAPDDFASFAPRSFAIAAINYAALVIVLQLLTQSQRFALTGTALLHFATDLGAIGLLVYATGGIDSGLGILLVPPLVGCSLVLPPRYGLTLAAIASLVILGEETWRQLRLPRIDSSDFSQVGLLGLMFFVTSFSAGRVGQRARQSEADIERVGTEFQSLTRLNDSIIAAMHDGVLVVDAGGTVRTANAAALRLTSGRAAPQHHLAETLPDLQVLLEHWREHGNDSPVMPIAGAGGRALLPRFTRLGPELGAQTLITLEDAAELRAQAQQLKLAALGRLSANIAHEIRNPLSAIAQAGQLLAESEMSGPDRRLLEMIQRHALRIEQIVRSVMEISRRAPAVRASLHLREHLLRDIALYHEAHPQQPRPVELGEIDAGLTIYFDPDQLQQVLFNLIDNSFAHGGENNLVLLDAGFSKDSGRVFLDVRDRGPGIAPELRERVFEPFFTTHHVGTGLGLYLCRELCEYNQAQIRYLDTPDGACFRIEFSSPVLR